MGTVATDRPAWQRYLIATLAIAIGWVARTALTPAVGPTQLPFVFFFPGVALAAWFGRWGAGAFAAGLSSALASWAFFDPPFTHLSLRTTYDFAATAAFLGSCAFIVGSIELMHRARRQLHSDAAEQRANDLERAKLAAIVEYSGDAILTKTLDGIIRSWNAGAEQLFGYTAEEAVGQPVTLLMPPERVHEEREILDRLHQGQAVERRETIRKTKDGRLLTVQLSVSPLRDREGRIVGASKIVHDVTAAAAAREAHRREQELLATRKDEFLAILSHELRNPLAPIRMAVGVLQRMGTTDAKVRELLSVIDRQSHQLTRLLDDLLDINRIASGKIALKTTRMPLGVAMSDAVEAVRPYLESMRHSLEVTSEDEGLEVEGDLARLAQVFTNLINNAVKYTEKGGRITVTVRRERQEAVVRVRDTGIGLTPGQLPRIFEMFAQVDQPTERGRYGLGVGLALSRTLVELHHGRIEASSEGLGRGSEFVVRLPALPPAAGRPAAAELPESVPSTRGLHILIADDNVDAVTVLTGALKLTGHQVRAAHDGAAALAAADGFQPDVALVDIGMPKLDGYEVARRLRARFGRKLVLIALTGWGQDEDRRRALGAGFDHHLTKPADLTELYRLISQRFSASGQSLHLM